MVKEEEGVPEAESYEFKISLAELLSGGVIIEVSNPDQAKIAEESGATAVTILESSSSAGGVIRMTNPEMIQKIQEVITIPIIAKCRIGHFAEAQILESLFVDFIDESEALTPADCEHYIDKHNFRIPFICGFTDLGNALRRVAEGVSLLRTEGTFETGNISKAVESMRSIRSGLRRVANMDHAELLAEATRLNAPYELLEEVAENHQLPVPVCAAGGIVTPADASLMIQLGAESVFVDSEIFKSDDPLQRAKAIVGAVTFYRDPEMLTKATLGHVLEIKSPSQRLRKDELYTSRGW